MKGMSATDRRCVSWQSEANEGRVAVRSKRRDRLGGSSGWSGIDTGRRPVHGHAARVPRRGMRDERSRISVRPIPTELSGE